MKTSQIHPLVLIISVFCVVAPRSNSAIIAVTDPTRVTGSNAISPDDAALEVSFNATNSTAVGTLTGLSTFGAVQNFSGFTGNQSAANDYIFAFTDATLPALRFRYTGSINTTSAVALANDGFSTSTNSAMRLQPLSNLGNFTMRIDLGSYNGISEVFSPGAGVEALGFTLSGRYYAITDNSITVTYLDSDNAVLSTQVLSTATAGSVAGYTGFQSLGNPISAVTIGFTGSGGDTPVFGLDDIGFTAIPEPGSLALILIGAFVIITLRRRRA